MKGSHEVESQLQTNHRSTGVSGIPQPSEDYVTLGFPMPSLGNHLPAFESFFVHCISS